MTGSDVRMRGFQSRSSLAEVERIIDTRVQVLEAERIHFKKAADRVLREDILATKNIPPHQKSAMDGYAVRAEEGKAPRQVVGEVKAAEDFSRALKTGEAVRIMTGAKVPEGADSVVMVEKTVLEDNVVSLKESTRPGENVFRIGEDLEQGQPVLSAGRRLRPQDLAMLVNVDTLEIPVSRRPRVTIVPTGTELVPVGQKPGPTELTESNSYMLGELAKRDGAEVTLHPIVRDDLDGLGKVLARQDADLIVVTGGSSVGQEDYAPVAVRKLGELPVHGVHLKPASPSGVGFIDNRVVVLAPGYPVASYVAWDFFCRRILCRMQGFEPTLPYATTAVRLATPVKKPEGRTEVRRVTFAGGEDGQKMAQLLPGGAALLSTLTKADGFVVLPAGRGEFAAGEETAAYQF